MILELNFPKEYILTWIQISRLFKSISCDLMTLTCCRKQRLRGCQVVHRQYNHGSPTEHFISNVLKKWELGQVLILCLSFGQWQSRWLQTSDMVYCRRMWYKVRSTSQVIMDCHLFIVKPFLEPALHNEICMMLSLNFNDNFLRWNHYVIIFSRQIFSHWTVLH